MLNIIKTSKSVVLSLDEFFDKLDLGILNFKKGISNYVNGHTIEFEQNLTTINQLEKEADSIQRKIENGFYLYSLMPNYASDILILIEDLDDIIDNSKDLLAQFDVETPNIPKSLKKDYLELASLTTKTAENVISASRIFFNSPEEVKERIQKVLFYHREADVLSNNLKRKIFQETEDLKLSEKMHLRYFAFQIEQISDIAKNIAHKLSSLVIKIKM